MGNLLRLLSKDDSTCCSDQRKHDIVLDFENAEPSESERELYEEVAQMLRESKNIIEDLSKYTGAAREIREAINDPCEDRQKRAKEAVVPLVMKLAHFYSFSLLLKETLPRLLYELCKTDMCPSDHLENQQALVKQFAEILEFTLKFDELKMTTPAIQNDLSYYRRTTRQLNAPCALGNDSHNLSIFFAAPTPMLKVISDATSIFVAEHKEIPLTNTTQTFGTMAAVCQRMLETPNVIARLQREETQLFILRVMVALVILYDHVHPVGAFVKASNVDVKGCIRVLKDQPASSSENLLNALRYTTKHLNDENTPRNIKTLLAV